MLYQSACAYRTVASSDKKEKRTVQTLGFALSLPSVLPSRKIIAPLVWMKEPTALDLSFRFFIASRIASSSFGSKLSAVLMTMSDSDTMSKMTPWSDREPDTGWAPVSLIALTMASDLNLDGLMRALNVISGYARVRATSTEPGENRVRIIGVESKRNDKQRYFRNEVEK